MANLVKLKDGTYLDIYEYICILRNLTNSICHIDWIDDNEVVCDIRDDANVICEQLKNFSNWHNYKNSWLNFDQIKEIKESSKSGKWNIITINNLKSQYSSTGNINLKEVVKDLAEYESNINIIQLANNTSVHINQIIYISEDYDGPGKHGIGYITDNKLITCDTKFSNMISLLDFPNWYKFDRTWLNFDQIKDIDGDDSGHKYYNNFWRIYYKNIDGYHDWVYPDEDIGIVIGAFEEYQKLVISELSLKEFLNIEI